MKSIIQIRFNSKETSDSLTADGLVETKHIGCIRMGTTVATNALLERAGDPVALVVNKGFKDLLFIGNQARPKIFELDIKKHANLYKQVVEVDCRIVPAHRGLCQLGNLMHFYIILSHGFFQMIFIMIIFTENEWQQLNGVSNSTYLEKNPIDEASIRSSLERVLADGITSLAIVLAHSFACPEHELRIGGIAKELGFSHITLSHQAMPMIRLVNRGYTACAEAYLTPHVERYLNSFTAGFKDKLHGVDVLFMQSDGGLTKMENFRGARAILSGPAGGVVGLVSIKVYFSVFS